MSNKKLFLVIWLQLVINSGFAQLSNTHEQYALEVQLKEHIENNDLSSNILVQNLEIRPHSQNSFSIVLPTQTDNKTRNEVFEMLAKIKSLCPDCANGGSPKGAPMVGPNINTGTPAFPINPNPNCNSDSHITLSKVEYEELLKRAGSGMVRPENCRHFLW